MTSATTPSSASFSRRWLWPFVFLSASVVVTSPFALVLAGMVYLAIASQSALSLSEVALAFGAGIVLSVWLWLIWFTVTLFTRRRSPLLTILDDGIEIPHGRLKFIAWDEIASVDQTESGRATYLRLRLVSPNESLSRWQQTVRWPLSDSVLITLGMDRSRAPDPAFVAVKARHAEHLKAQNDTPNARA